MLPLFCARLKALKNWFRAMLAQRWEFFKVLGTAFFGIILISGLYWWFLRFFSYLASVAVVGPLLTQKLLEIAFLSGFSLIALSAMVASLSTHYGSSDLGFLFATPLKNISIFLMKSLETTVHASWMVALVLVPFLMALVRVKHLDAGFVVLACVLFIPFVFTAAMGGIALSSLFVWFFPRRKFAEFLSVLGILVFIFLYAGVRLTLPQKLIHPERMEEVLEYLLYLQTPAAPFFPSRWYVESLNAYQAALSGKLAYSILILGAFGVLAFVVCLVLGTKIVTRKKWLQVWEGG